MQPFVVGDNLLLGLQHQVIRIGQNNRATFKLFTLPFVAQKTKAGVLKVPWGVFKRPKQLRLWAERCLTVNEKGIPPLVNFFYRIQFL